MRKAFLDWAMRMAVERVTLDGTLVRHILKLMYVRRLMSFPCALGRMLARLKRLGNPGACHTVLVDRTRKLFASHPPIAPPIPA